MHYNKAIFLNQAALRRIAEEIFALVELLLDGTVKRLPHVFHVAAYRLLIPAEAALRRLIVIAAREIMVVLPPQRIMPKGLRITAKGVRPLSFQLYDTRKRFEPAPSFVKKTITPRVHFFNAAPLVATFLPLPKKQTTSTRLCRRFAAFKVALENIPHQAQRMALWKAKRAQKSHVKFRLPLRPGAPPGWHRKMLLEVDEILKECNAIALSPHQALLRQ